MYLTAVKNHIPLFCMITSEYNCLLFIHHISGKLNFLLLLARRALWSHQCGPRTKNFGDLWDTIGDRESIDPWQEYQVQLGVTSGDTEV